MDSFSCTQLILVYAMRGHVLRRDDERFESSGAHELGVLIERS